MSQPTPEEMKQLDAAVKVATKAGVDAAEETSKRVLAEELAKVNFAYRIHGGAEATVVFNAEVGERIDGTGAVPCPGKQEAFIGTTEALNAALAKGARVVHVTDSLVIIEHPPGPTSEERNELTMAWSRNAVLANVLDVIRDRVNDAIPDVAVLRIKVNGLVEDALSDGLIDKANK